MLQRLICLRAGYFVDIQTLLNFQGAGLCLQRAALNLIDSERDEKLAQKVDYLHSAEYGEAGEESKGASYQTQLGVESQLLILFYLVIGCCVKVDMNKLQGRESYGAIWKRKVINSYFRFTFFFILFYDEGS